MLGLLFKYEDWSRIIHSSVYLKKIMWSFVFGFLQVTVIFEIIIRKCGSAAVKPVIPEKYKDFIKKLLEVLLVVLIKGPIT